MSVVTLVKAGQNTLKAADRYARDELKTMGDGEYLVGVLRRPRNISFHRKMFAMLQFAFDQWNPGEQSIAGMPARKSFDSFRKELTIAAGYYEQICGMDGKPRLEAKSLAFDRMGQKEAEEVYEGIVSVLTSGIMHGMTKEQLERMANAVQEEGF